MIETLDLEKLARLLKLETAGEGEHHHAHRGWVQTHCPFCTDGSHGFHLGFNVERGNWNCWRCSWHSSWDVVGAFLRTKRPDLIGRVIAQCQSAKRIEQRILERKYAKKLEKIPGLRKLRRAHHEYLDGRGFDSEKLEEEWGLLGTTDESGAQWNWRVVAAICDVTGRPVGWVGRSTRASEPRRYRVTERENLLCAADELIYGIERATGDSVLITEGPTGPWRVGPGTVATLGIDWRRPQVNLLRKFKRRFVYYDPEALAQRRARKLADQLAMFRGETVVLEGLATDPGDMRDCDARALRRELKLGAVK